MIYGEEIPTNWDVETTTRAEMAAALRKMKLELEARIQAERELRLTQQELEQRIRQESKASLEHARKYQKLVEETNDLIVHLDRRGHLTFINRAAQELFEMEPSESFGISILRIVHPDDRQKVKLWWDTALADKAVQTSIELRQVSIRSESVFCLQWSASFHYNTEGEMTGIGAIGRDVSAIRRAERNYSNLFNKMLDGFALHEVICRNGEPVDYRFLSVNPAFEALTGLKAEKLIGKTVLEVLPTTEQHWIDTYGKVALTGEPVTFENYSAAIDKFFEVAAYCPAPNQFACIFQDITPRKKAEQEKALLETQLRKRHKMEAIGTLAGGIAHDFNNILTAILGYTDMALEELPSWSPTQSKLQEVLKAGNRARDLVRQILAFSRREEQRREPVDLKVLIREAVVFLRSTIPTTIDLYLDLDPQCGNVLADQTQIHQVLMNICTNAYQAMESGGGTLSISLREVPSSSHELDHTFNLPTMPFVRLDISDTGPGIKDEHLDRIFDPYFTTKAFGKGSGMGLAVVHGIVKSHDGLIRVTGNYPQGTCFSLFFPKTDQQPASPVAVENSYDSGSERLLLVDDDPSIARMIQTFMERQGYATTILDSSRKALEMFRTVPDAFDLIITDQTMPDMTGEELATKVLGLRPDIPIILCTGYSTVIDEIKAKDKGIKAFLMKPVALKELAATVRQLLDEL